MKRISPLGAIGSKLFPLREDPILKRLHCPGKQKEVIKAVSLVKMIDNHGDVPHTLTFFKGDNFCDFLFSSLDDKILSKWGLL